MKTFTLRLFAGFLFVLCISNSYAQNAPVITVVQGKLIRVTPPLSQIDNKTMYGEPLKITRRGDGFAGGITDPERAEEGIHRNIKKNSDAPTLTNGFIPGPNAPTSSINQNFDGQVFPNFAPSDNNLAVGPNHVIQIINHSSGAAFKIWNKSGGLVQDSKVLSTITGLTGDGDPVVLYDQLADRWVLTEFGETGSVSYINTLIIAVSTSSDPTGSWKVYSYVVQDNGTNYFVDYPKYAVWQNAYYATSNDFNTAGNSYLGSSIYAFDKTAMINGAPTATMIRTRLNNASQRYYSMAPVCQEGMATSNQSGLFAFVQDNTWVSGSTADSIYTFEFTPNFANPASSVVGPFKQLKSNLAFNTNTGNLSQPRPGGSIQALNERLMHKIIYRNFGSYESIVCNLTDLQGTGTGVHWWELRRTGGSGNWSIYQEGFYHPDNNNRFMGSIAINANGDIGLLYNVVSSSVYPSARFTGRSSCDPLGQMTLTEQVIQNGSTYEGNNRYGDYNSLSVDGFNNSFWGTAQYNATGGGTYGNWKTRVVNFTLTSSCSGCTSVSISTQPSNSTVCTGVNTSFSVVASGTSPNYQWQVSTSGCNGTWTNLTNNAPYSGVTTATLNITAPNVSLNGNVYRVVVSNSCPSTINSSCVSLTVNPNVTAGTVSGASPVCIGNMPQYTVNNATPGGTWSSTNTNVATVNSNGVVTAVNAGTADIKYTVNSGCGSPVSSSQTITVNPNVTAGTVSGTSPLCVGGNATYSSNGTPGGSWSSSNTSVATVNSGTGNVSAVGTGVANIIYTVSSGCGSPVTSSQSLTVNDNPNPGTIIGTTPLCIGQQTTYTSSGTSGGSWSSSDLSVATVNTNNGLVTATGSGTVNIIYSVTDCNGNSQTSYQTLNVNPNANAGTVSGTTPLCVGQHATYSNNGGDVNGTWTSSNTSVATVNATSGDVTTVGVGTTSIIYSVTNDCSTSTASQSLTVSDVPNAGAVSGTSSVCVGSTTQFSSNGDPNGSWSSSNTSTATVNSSGVVTGVAVGSANIIYTVSNSCGTSTASQLVTVTSCAPTITCPANISTSTTSGCSKSIATPDPTTNGTSLTWTMTGATTGSGSQNVGTKNFNIGITNITYTASNASGSSTCSFTVTVTDNTLSITCPANINNQQNGNGKCSATIAIPNPTTNGNCSVTKLTWVMSGALSGSSPSSGINYVGTKTFPVGITTITYTLTNGLNQDTTCSFTVTVRNTKCPNSPPATPEIGNATTVNNDGLSVQVFPNPSETYFTLAIQSTRTENVEISVYTITGKLVQKMKGNVSEVFRFGDNYIAGAYVVKVQQGAKQTTVKVVK